jgi:NitT/TauT family transport system substrate-binding protein
MGKISFHLIAALFGLLALAGCAAPGPQIGATPEPVTLKVAVIPVLDTLPMHVAKQEGLFEEHGVVVELIPVGSAPERDQLIAAGQADGMLNEVVSTMFFNREQVQVQIVRYGQAAAQDVALFSILAAGSSDIHQIEDLKGVEVGVSQGTVIEYLNDRLLQAEGFTPSDIRVIAVPRIDLRMSLLGSGELKAAMLPEPLTSLALQQGARVILDDRLHPEYSFSTISFRKAVIDSHPEAIRSFLAAVEEATQRINAGSGDYNNLMSELNLVPQPLEGKFRLSRYVTAGIPTESQWNDTLEWAKEKGLLDRDLPYQDSVRSDLLP